MRVIAIVGSPRENSKISISRLIEQPLTSQSKSLPDARQVSIVPSTGACLVFLAESDSVVVRKFVDFV